MLYIKIKQFNECRFLRVKNVIVKYCILSVHSDLSDGLKISDISINDILLNGEWNLLEGLLFIEDITCSEWI